MWDDILLGYYGMGPGPTAERARMAQRRLDYQTSGGYGVAPSFARRNFNTITRFASEDGRSLIDANTRFYDPSLFPDRFGGFPMEPDLFGDFSGQSVPVYTPPQAQPASMPTPVGQGMRRGVAGSDSLMNPIGQSLLGRQRQMLEATQPAPLSPGMQDLFDEIRQQRMATTQAQPASMPTTAQALGTATTSQAVSGAPMPTTPQALSTAVTPPAVSGAPMEPIALRAMEPPTSLQGLPQPTSVAGDVGNFFRSKQGGALLAAGGALLASGILGGRPDESPIIERIKELEGTEQYGRFLDIASRTAPSRADYLGVMAARGGSAVQAEEAAQAAQSRAAREAVSEYNKYRVAADAQAAELRLALQQQREERRLAKIKGFGSALGAGLGFFVAGPGGAQIGGALGSGAGSILGDLTD